MSLSAMEIFKHLPGGKREDNANCKKCKCPTCMMFAMKLAKNQADISLCPYICDELREKLEHNKKVQQKICQTGRIKIGGETVLYRHEKTFNNPCALVVALDCRDYNFDSKLNRVLNFEIECVGKKYKIDGVYLKNPTQDALNAVKNSEVTLVEDEFLSGLRYVEFVNLPTTVSELTHIRTQAVVNRNQDFCEPVYLHLKEKNLKKLCAQASALLCKYANMLLIDEFDEALFTSLITLRINIYTDPQKPLQVESKVYEFNNPDENALVFLTTNFALSYFAVANELSSLKRGSYLVITPSEGMSVLTAWSAQKITADIASKIVSASNILDKVKNKRLIIPGLLSDLKDELQEALTDWEIVVGTSEAYKIPEFVKKLED